MRKIKNPAYEISSVKGKALNAAAEILASQGVDELNLRAIAEKAEIGVASIYHYFANKEELLLNLAIKGFSDLRRNIIRFPGRPEYPTNVAAGARAFFGFAEARPALFSLMFSERLLARHEALREAEQETFLAYEELIAADGRFPKAEVANIAIALWALGRGIAAIISSQPDGKLPPDLAARIWAGSGYFVRQASE